MTSIELLDTRFKLINPQKYINAFVQHGIHTDGRELSQFRKPSVVSGVISNAVGSAAVKLGNSNVIAGIRAELAKPKLNAPGSGFIVPNIDASIVSFAAGISDSEVDVLIYELYRIFSSSTVIKLEDLCVHRTKLVWALFIDVVCVDVDGGLFDAVVLSCVNALKNLQLPQVIFDEKTNKVEFGPEKVKLNVDTHPIISTFGICGDRILADPTLDEELASNSLMHIGTFDNDIGYVQKVGGIPIKYEDVEKSMTIAMERHQELSQETNKSN